MWVRSGFIRFCLVVAIGIYLYRLLISPSMRGIVRLSTIELKLVQVQVFFRHGARTPLHYVKSPLTDAQWTPDCTKDVPESVIPIKHVDIFRGTPVDESTYDLIYKSVHLPGGEAIGMLTTTGQKDLYNLGSRLRKDYVGGDSILSDPPKFSEIEARSTRVGRNIKSLRSLVAGLTKGQANGTLVVSSMAFESEVLFPNPKTFSNAPFDEGTAELRNDSSLSALKKKIREALKVDRLVDELDTNEMKHAEDCQVYYVRDDYIARKHNGFPIPEALEALQPEMDHYSSVELLSELLGKRENWIANLPVNIGPVLYIILSKMHKYASIPPLQLFAVHDSTILPMLLTLKCCEEMWPPFGADITFELYVQVLGPSHNWSHPNEEPIHAADAPHSHIDWSAIQVNRMWVRVCYLGRPLPLASMWCAEDDAVQQLTGSDEYVPLLHFVSKLTPLALSMKDFRAKCRTFAEKANPGGIKEEKRGPKNL